MSMDLFHPEDRGGVAIALNYCCEERNTFWNVNETPDFFLPWNLPYDDAIFLKHSYDAVVLIYKIFP